MTFKNGMRPVHPGEVLREEYLKPSGLSANALAKALRLSPSRIGDIVLERRGVTADIAVRLARCGRLNPLSNQRHEQTFPRKRMFTTIRNIRCK
jgi:addiction module HigA family antidote